MKIVIEIPSEFETHFEQDRFEDSLHRLSADAHLLAGNYEQEVLTMLIKAFKDCSVIKVSEDAISRKWLEEHKEVISYKNEWYETETDEFVSWENIEDAPSVLPKVNRGEWIEEFSDDGWKWVKDEL